MRDLPLVDYALPASITRELVSPALVIDVRRVRRNVDRILSLTGSPDRWRPHVKTTKIPAIWSELVAAGVRQFKCATAREAALLGEMLHSTESPGGDVLLAYPAIGPTLQLLGELARRYPETRFSVISEDPAHVAQVPQGVDVFIDLDPGYHRTGLALDARAAILAVARAAGGRFRGLHAYEGHLYGPDLDQRREAAFAIYDELLAIMRELEAAGFACEELITSGTPGFRCALNYEPFAELERTRHRVSPGTVVYHDTRSDEENPGLELEPAALVFTRIISHPGERRVTCDAGSKSVAAEAGDPCALVIGHPELVAQTPSEEHLPLDVRSGPSPTRGSELYLVPRHVCPTINLASEALLIDEGPSFTPVAIAARGHDLLLSGATESSS